MTRSILKSAEVSCLVLETSLKSDLLQFSDFPIMIVCEVSLLSRESLVTNLYGPIYLEYYYVSTTIKIHAHANFSLLLLHSLTIYIEENLGSDYNYNLRKSRCVFIHVFVLEYNFYIVLI